MCSLFTFYYCNHVHNCISLKILCKIKWPQCYMKPQACVVYFVHIQHDMKEMNTCLQGFRILQKW